MEKTSVQIVRDNKGAPVAAVVPWKEYERLCSYGNEDAMLIKAADAARDDETFPAEVAKRLIAGEVPLKVFREWRKLTQAHLAIKAGVSEVYLSQIERGVEQGGRSIGKKVAEKLSSVLGVSVAALMDL